MAVFCLATDLDDLRRRLGNIIVAQTRDRKSVRAAEAVMANPEKSDRAIAADIGVSPMTVNRARSTVPDVTVERTGLDGKTRKMRKAPEKKPEPDPTR